MFLIMTAAWCRGWLTKESDPAKLKRAFMYIAAASAAYGIAMEFVQLFWIPNRAFELKDILADTLGSLIGLSLSSRWYIKK
jgi:VanZ family protein